MIFLRRLSIRAKLFIAFTLCVNLIIGIVSYLYYQQTAHVIRAKNKEATQQMLYRFGSSVDRIFKDIDRISAQIQYDTEINAYFAAPGPWDENSYYTFVKIQKIENLIQNFNGPALAAKRIIIFNLNGNYVDFGLNWDTYTNFKERFAYAPWIDPTIQKNGEKELVPPRPTEWQTTEEVVFSVSRRLNKHTLIEVQQPYSLLEQTVTDGITRESAASIYIYDDAGRIFYPYGLSRIPVDLHKKIAGPYGTEVTHLETGDPHIINLLPSSYTGLTIALLQPKAALSEPIRQLTLLSILIIGAAELLALLLSYWIAKTITSPILKLQRYVRKVNLDNVPNSISPIQFNHSNEVNELYETFVKMTVGLHSSMNQVIDLKSRENLAQMQALYAQMNPHFLYNTLTSIGRLAEESADPNIAKMCYKLTQMLRYSTLSISTPVSIKEELTHATSFLELMKMRFEHQFHYEVAMDPALENELVPKLILQPFLENCFTHGFQQVEPPWTIRIGIQQEPVDAENWSISIIDNGIGFTPSALQKIQEIIDTLHSGQELELQQITTRGLGNVGIENTLTRCRMFWKFRIRFTVRNLHEGNEIRLQINQSEEVV